MRKVLHSGELGIVEKVGKNNLFLLIPRSIQLAPRVNCFNCLYFLHVLPLSRLELMIYRPWQTDWLSRASAHRCLNVSPSSPSSERR